MDPHFFGLIPVQGSLNLSRLASDIGIYGNAYFLPPGMTGENRVMQFNPLSSQYWNANKHRREAGNALIWSEYSLRSYIPGESPVTPGIPHGLMTVPPSDPLVKDLRKRNALVIPKGNEELSVLLRETIVDISEFASRISITWESDLITITLHEYRFIDACRFASSESPQSCGRYPCPACSLCGSLIAEGMNTIVALDKCMVSSPQDITAVFSFK